MKTNPMPGNEIEFFSEVGQRNLRMNPRDHAVDVQERGCASEKRIVIGIKSHSLVSEVSTDVEKIAGAAAKIENAQWRGAIQPKILRAFHIDGDPVGRVFVPVDPAGI
jgi:hypothetical protein